MTITTSLIEQSVLEHVDIKGLLVYLDQLVAIRTTDGNETEAQRHVAAKMAAIGLHVDEWPLDFAALRRHPAYCEELARQQGLGVVGNLGANDGPSLILNAHVDVVPVEEPDAWRYDPWRATVDEGNVYGRGALDMKGALCCALFAAKAIVDSGVKLAGRLSIQSVIGEEDGGVGTLATILRGYRADAAIVLEPTAMMIAPAHAGALNFRIIVPGRAAHGAMRAVGVNPIDKFYPLLQALRQFEAERCRTIRDSRFDAYALPYAICIGTLRAGSWASSVPQSLVCEGRFGVAVGEDVSDAKGAFERTIMHTAAGDDWLRANPPQVIWWGGQFEAAGIDPAHPIVTTVAEALQSAGAARPHLQGMTYGADMRLLVHYAHTPTILFGPGDVRNAHQPNEFVPVAELALTTRTLVLTILRHCGVC